jgi:3-hydroxybutyrate dehydrogenase
VDIVINNAGIQHVAPVEHFAVEKWNDIIAINLSSVFHTSRLALPGMRARNWGRIINIASVHGLVASKDKSAYVAAKHGVIGLSKTLALETARTGVTCNAICPGWVLTPLVQQQIDKRIAEGSDPSRPANSCWRKSSPPASLSPRNSWVNWRCFSVAKAPPGARRGMEHGRRLGRAITDNLLRRRPFLLSSASFFRRIFPAVGLFSAKDNEFGLFI